MVDLTDPTILIAAYAGMGLIFCLLIVRILRAPAKAYLLTRESPVTFILQKAKIRHEKNPPSNKLVLNSKDSFDLTEGHKKYLVKTSPKTLKYSQLFFESNGQLVYPTDNIESAMPPLMQPKDLAEEGERKALGWLDKISTGQLDRGQLIMGALLGLAIGYAIFSYWHPGFVQAPPDGYQYVVEHTTSTFTGTHP